MVATSALDGRGLGKLKEAVEAALQRLAVKVDCVVPYAEAALLAEVRATSTISEEDFVEQGTRFVAYVPPDLRNRLDKVCRAAGTPFKGSPLEAAEDRSSRHAGAGAGSAAADPMELGQELSPN